MPGRLALALVVAAIALVVPAAARDPAGPTGATILYRSPAIAAAQGVPSRAGLVIRHSDGRTETRCVDFAEAQISGYDLLRRSGLSLAVAQGSEGIGICKINGEGCDPAQCLTCRGSTYWSYFHLVNGVWQYSNVGAAGYQVRPGALEGWTFGNGLRPPEASFAQVCAAPAVPTATLTTAPVAPTPTPTSPPAGAAPASRAGAAPPPIVLVVGATPTASVAPSPSPTPLPPTVAPTRTPLAAAAASTSAASPLASAPAAPTPGPLNADGTVTPTILTSPTSPEPVAPDPAAAPPTAAPTRPPASVRSAESRTAEPSPQPSPTEPATSYSDASRPAATAASPPLAATTAAPAAGLSAPAGSLLPLGEGQDEGVPDGRGGPRPHPSPLPEGEGTLSGPNTPVGPALDPQPSAINPAPVAAAATVPPSGGVGTVASLGLGPGHILFGAASLALIGYLALASPRPK